MSLGWAGTGAAAALIAIFMLCQPVHVIAAQAAHTGSHASGHHASGTCADTLAGAYAHFKTMTGSPLATFFALFIAVVVASVTPSAALSALVSRVLAIFADRAVQPYDPRRRWLSRRIASPPKPVFA